MTKLFKLNSVWSAFHIELKCLMDLKIIRYQSLDICNQFLHQKVKHLMMFLRNKWTWKFLPKRVLRCDSMRQWRKIYIIIKNISIFKRGKKRFSVQLFMALGFFFSWNDVICPDRWNIEVGSEREEKYLYGEKAIFTVENFNFDLKRSLCVRSCMWPYIIS